METRTWIRVSQAAHELGLSTQAVRNLIHSEKLQGRKADNGHWVVQAKSVSDHLATHGRRRSAGEDLARLQRQIDELVQAVDAMRDARSSMPGADVATEQERDRYRAEAAADRTTALLALDSADEVERATRNMLEGMRLQREALRQRLLPDMPEQSQPAIERKS